MQIKKKIKVDSNGASIGIRATTIIPVVTSVPASASASELPPAVFSTSGSSSSGSSSDVDRQMEIQLEKDEGKGKVHTIGQKRSLEI